MNFFKKLSKKTYDFINNGGWRVCYTLAITGIIAAMIGMYMIHPKGWGWIVFFDIPVFIFVIWVFKVIANGIKELEKIDKERNEKNSR